MKLSLILYSAVFCLASALSIDDKHFQKFLEFTTAYNKVYADNELDKRYAIFANNVDTINAHNSESHSYTLAINKFADLTQDEFRGTYLHYNPSEYLVGVPRLSFARRASDFDTPSSIDWVEKSAVTPVKDQAQCGSCWAFSTTGSVEGAYFLSSGKLVSLSEQQLVDCAGSYGNQGCNGGTMDDGFGYVKDKGLCLEDDYPYTASDGTCKPCKVVTKIKSFVDVPTNESDLKKAVSGRPVSVAIDASGTAFQFYNSGVIPAKSCGTQLDHGVLVVGYVKHNKTDVWKVKNSWGSSWGDEGYFLLERGVNACGINLMASYPVV